MGSKIVRFDYSGPNPGLEERMYTPAKLAAIAGIALATIASAATVTRVNTFPDGTKVEYFDNGDYRTTTVTGYVAYISHEGWERLTMPDGTTRTRAPGGYTYTKTASGTLVIEYPDGSTKTVQSDGTKIEYELDGTVITYNPDGTITKTYPDGTKETTLPTNPLINSKTVDPDSGSSGSSGGEEPTKTTITPALASGGGDSGGDDDGGATGGNTGGGTTGGTTGGTSTTYEAPTLVPGAGFGMQYPGQPSPVGAPAQPGFDAKAIARWDVVPYQDVDGVFSVGVIAFHINGIDRVDFSVQGGPWVSVKQMELNPRTGVAEYWVNIDKAKFKTNGMVEVRAVAWPTVGIPRVLGGPDDGSVASLNGNHGLFLNIVDDADTPSNVVFCSPYGSDATGDGTKQNPYRQPALAAAKAPSGEDLTVYCEPGNYSFGPKPWPRAKNSKRWLTIEPAPGATRDQVIFDKYEVGGFGGDAQLLRFHNISIVGSQISFNGKRVWFDNCAVVGVRTEDYKIISSAWIEKSYVTNCWINNTCRGMRGADFMRGTHYGTSSSSPFGSARFVVDCSVKEYDNSGTAFHGDVFHWFPQDQTTENIIVYNVDARNFDSQGVFAECMGDNKKFDNVAIVNLHISKDLPPTNGSKAGSWWERDTNHLLIWNSAILEQAFRWKLVGYGTTLRNVSIRGSIFRNFSIDRIDDMGFQNIVVEDNHFTDLSEYGAFSIGEDTTIGDPKFRDREAGDYRPAAGSPLLDRIESPNTRFDINELERVHSDIGPREGA